MSLLPPPKVRKLQKTLHAKAKGSPAFRFYALYDKVYRDDVLWVAYRRCLANGGAAGTDGQTFEDIEAYGRDEPRKTQRLAEVEAWLRHPGVAPVERHAPSPVVAARSRAVFYWNIRYYMGRDASGQLRAMDRTSPTTAASLLAARRL